MELLFFFFQDDDFPLFGPAWHRWTREFVAELHRSGLPKHAIWKINCWADAVDPQLFVEMRDAGLYLVYMGLESCTEERLKTLHKADHGRTEHRRGRCLKEAGHHV